METADKTFITVEATIIAPVHQVWKFWTSPEHIVQWNNASANWHTTRVENDLRNGGSFLSRMEAKDGSFGFDFSGAYNEIITNELIVYTLFDGRKVYINFAANGNTTTVTEKFEAEKQNSIELQKGGWQSILNNFKHYVESKV